MQQTTVFRDKPLKEAVSTPEQPQQQMLFDMEALIQRHDSSIKTLKEEKQKHKEMLDDIFASSEAYKQAEQNAKEAIAQKAKAKAEILKQPHAAELTEKVKELASEIKETKEGMSDYLAEYHQLTGLNELEGADGSLKQIVKKFELK